MSTTSRDRAFTGVMAISSGVTCLSSFSMESMVRGQHIYKDRWCPYINKELTCHQERHNYHNPFAVSVQKSSIVVGHVPQQISAICYIFLGKHSSSISCKITGSRRFSHDLPQGGMEVPCMLTFQGQKNLVEKTRNTITKLKIGMSTLVKATGSTPAIYIDVTGSSNTSVKTLTELSSPGQPKVYVNAKVIDSSEVTVKIEVSLPAGIGTSITHEHCMRLKTVHRLL